MFKELFSEDWYEEMKDYIESKEFLQIALQIVKERTNKVIYPEPKSKLLFKVFKEVPLSKVKVVILGQDPYHDGSYDGLAFSNTNRKRISPSLRNILKEINQDIYNGEEISIDPSLYRWAEQGVFLVNTSQTVVKGMPGSHLHYWKGFTSKMINVLNNKDNIIWMLWGAHAKSYINEIINPSHYIIQTGHPSPLNRTIPFIGSKCFSECNEQLKGLGKKEILW
jgi:uracil-DNA glycosylase